jgi:glycoprotein-N-acetylgalactosamine 3-beta-galactosyltransferase
LLTREALPFLSLARKSSSQRCDGFFAASNKTDASLGAVNIPHAGPETYLNMWQKVRSIWSYVYDTYYDKYDWFHIGGDDLYLIVDNLRLYLGSEEIRTAANGGEYLPDGTETTQVPLFLGRRFARKGDGNVLFNSGGPGYTLNRAALKVLVARGMPHYYQHDRGPAEDVKVARVLRQFGVFPYETKDETGAERYMPFMPGAHYDYKIGSNERDYDLYGIGIREGADCCSARSVAFHYASPGAMRRMHALLYGHCGPARARQ